MVSSKAPLAIATSATPRSTTNTTSSHDADVATFVRVELTARDLQVQSRLRSTSSHADARIADSAIHADARIGCVATHRIRIGLTCVRAAPISRSGITHRRRAGASATFRCQQHEAKRHSAHPRIK